LVSRQPTPEPLPAPTASLQPDLSQGKPLDLMRQAMAEHLAGNWAESNQALEACLRQLESRPDFKLGEESGAFLLDQHFKDYAGDPEELVFLHSLGMLNYAMQAQQSEALVEARRSDVLQRWLQDGKRAHADDPLARILSAELYADQGQMDDARIDLERARDAYQALEQDAPPFLDAELARIRASRRSKALAGSRSAVWVLVYNGRLTVKGAKAQSVDLAEGLSVSVDGGQPQSLQQVEDLEPGLNSALRERSGGDVLRSTGRIVLRVAFVAALAMVAGGHALNDSTLDFIAGGAQRETRHWDNLPARVQALCLKLRPGLHTLKISAATDAAPRHLDAAIKVPRGRTTLLQASLQGVDDGLHLSPSLQP
jgi:hypothetical protein